MRQRKSSVRGSPIIELEHCSLVLDGHAALDDVSFALRPGERWALVGPNGAGKTLMLKMLRGDVWPTPNGRERVRWTFDGETSTQPAGLKHLIAYVGPERQDRYVRYGWNLTVRQVVTTGLFDEDIPLTTPTRAQSARVQRALARFGLARLADRGMLTLSYGQRRLALLARAFVSEARVLLLDEAFNGLDARAKETLRRALEQPRDGRAWVMTSHRPHELPRNVTHAARLERGRIVASGAIDEVDLDRPALGIARRTAEPGKAQPRSEVRRDVPSLNSFSGLTAKDAEEFAKHSGLFSGRAMVRFHLKPPVASLEPARAARRATPFIALRNVTIYRDYRPVIRNLDWTIRRGEHWAVLGPNGSGKSSLIAMLHGDLHPALGGEVLRDGFERGAHIEQWKRRVGWLSPELQADHYLAKSIEEIVISGRYASVGLNEPPTRAERAAARRWLEFFGIASLRDRGPRQVSYGQMRLALIARAMVNEPELLLLDEPCSGLDGDVRAHVLELIERLARSGVQLIMAVHDPEDIAPAVTKVLRIGRGGACSTGAWPG